MSLQHICRVHSFETNIAMDSEPISADMSHVEYSPPRLGWMSGPAGQGTLDIVWSYIITISLC